MEEVTVYWRAAGIEEDGNVSHSNGSFSVGNDFPGKVFHYLPKNFPRKNFR
jgi:hypothetical protein